MATHRFHPTHYHLTIGSHDPVLRIADGDTVVTTTVVALGRDANDELVAPRGYEQWARGFHGRWGQTLGETGESPIGPLDFNDRCDHDYTRSPSVTDWIPSCSL